MGTDPQVLAVQRTFELILPLADTFAMIFYDRFFTAVPDARPLFKSDMASQREKVIEMLALTVRGLDQPDSIVDDLSDLGRRHVTYRVKPEHYPVLNEAIVYALDECLGDQFTADMHVAWTTALNTMTEIMLDSA